MADPQCAELWKSALKRYEQDTKTAIQVHISDTDTPNDLLQKVHGDFSQFREKGKRLRDKMKPVLRLVGLFAEMTGEAVGTKYPPGKAIFAGIRVLLEASKSVSFNYDSIVEMFEYFNEFLGRLEVHNKHKITDPVKKIILEFLAQLLSVIGLTTKLIKEGRMKRYFKSMIREDNDVKDAMAKLDRLTKQEDRVVSSVTLSVVNTILASLEEQMRSGKEEIISARDIILKAIRESNDGEFAEKVQKWLSPPDPSTNHNNALELRHSETGKWLIDEDQYVSWKKTPKSFLWIYGRPGSGKTILSSTIIEDLKRECGLNPSFALAYFYHDFRTPEKLLVRKLLCSLIVQLSRCCSTTPDDLKTLYGGCRNGLEQPSYDSMISTLREISGLFHHTYIVVDALDECMDPERSRLLDFIGSVCTWGLDGVHLLATSRPEPDIRQRLVMAAETVDLEATIVDQDIMLYIKTRLESEEQFRQWIDEEKNMIEETLTRKAHGIFRWVSCQLDELKKCKTFGTLKRALSSLPRTLGETYERMLSNIDDADAPNALRILRWLVFATEPLTLEEVAFAAMIDVDDEDPFNDDNRLRDPQDVLRICSGLITMTTYGDVQLSHFSVKEFFDTGRSGSGSYNQRFDLSAEVSQVFICRACFAILLQPTTDLSAHKSYKIDIPLARYAACYWIDSQVIESSPSLLESLKALFRPDSPQYLNWVKLMHLTDDGVLDDENENVEPLYSASLLGVVELARFLVMDGEDPNRLGGSHGTSLHAASYQGHEEIVQLLLNNGADINAQNVAEETALQVASLCGQEGIVRLLLEKGADVNAQARSDETALQAASSNGYEEIVRLLLKKGADVNAQARYDETPLQAASSSGYKEIVRLLLEKGADVNVQGGDYGTALQAASSNGYEEIVRLLLENGADVNAQGGHYENALQAALSKGDKGIVRLLLENGADVNAQGGYYGNALQAASSKGDEGIVQLLLENGADVNTQGGYYETALQAAIYKGDEGIVRLLLDNGADVNAQGVFYDSALEAASNRGRDNIVQLLLEHGAIRVKRRRLK